MPRKLTPEKERAGNVMSRKLVALDLALVALLAWAGFGLRNEWLAAKARQEALRKAPQRRRPRRR